MTDIQKIEKIARKKLQDAATLVWEVEQLFNVDSAYRLQGYRLRVALANLENTFKISHEDELIRQKDQTNLNERKE